MHRIAGISSTEPSEDIALVEQPSATSLFLTSAKTDIATLSAALADPSLSHWNGQIKALDISALYHPAQIDHYISTTAKEAKLVVIRLLGGRGHWSYGLEQFIKWQSDNKERILIVLAGTADQDESLNSLGSLSIRYSTKLAKLLREGGINNMKVFLKSLLQLRERVDEFDDSFEIEFSEDPIKWDWKTEQGRKIGIIMYKALYQANDLALPKELNKKLRLLGLIPRTLFVSSLRDESIKNAIINLFKREQVELIITTTSFASIEYEERLDKKCLWDGLNIPVLQLLTSSSSIDHWNNSSVGLQPVDLSLQVVLPEIDGRITTRPGAFREKKRIDTLLSSNIEELVPYNKGIEWVARHANKWTLLNNKLNKDKRIVIVLANYPIRDGRIANGVGLDTPRSALNILNWLKDEGYFIDENILPKNSNELINRLLRSRTNSDETKHLTPLDYLPLTNYLKWWSKVDIDVKTFIEKRWGDPTKAIDLDETGFAIIGLQFGNIAILLQPSRGYDSDNITDIHSPDLPPPHRYLAQYLWMRDIFKCNLVIHLGKHGSVEWLPGKGVGISSKCSPDLAMDCIPNVYPFIVNDPGEGSQAKRRTQAVILDHMTPPLGRAKLYGQLDKLESLMDEYYESCQLHSNRSKLLEDKIVTIIRQEKLSNIELDIQPNSLPNNDELFNKIESYLCELKEAQIRTGLHRLGEKPSNEKMIELLLCICRPPTSNYPGLTQEIANKLGLELDPWIDEEGDKLSEKDISRIKRYSDRNFRKVGDAVDFIEEQALYFLTLLIADKCRDEANDSIFQKLALPIYNWLLELPQSEYHKHIKNRLWINLFNSYDHEKKALINVLNGKRIESGPSGAPSRGRQDVLPTGRNFYSVDLRGLPTEAAWDLGRRSSEKLLEIHLLEEGQHLKKMAMSVWGTATMRNGGEDIAELFSLIGVRPVWDGRTRRMVDIEIIPLSILGRPRVDVTLRISGLFRDAFPQLVSWVYIAQMRVSMLDESDEMNPLAKINRRQGFTGRIFGSAPGSYGAGLQALIDSGAWEKREDLGKSYIEWSKWRYDGVNNPILDREGLESSLKDIEVVLHNQDNREHDILDSDDYYQFQGGLSAAIEAINGKKPTLLFGDHSRPERIKITNIEKEISKVVRSRMLNPRWIKGMIKHGYKGGFEMGASVDYLFAYDASTDSVEDWCYEEIYDKWLCNKDVSQFLYDNNPWVLRDISERLLEASNRSMWKTCTISIKDNLKSMLIKSEEKIENSNY